MSIDIRQLSIIIIQAFALFAALSMLLGRVYFLEFSDTLRVPESEFDLSAIDYAVLSPNVTIASVGSTVVFAAYMFGLALSQANSCRTDLRKWLGISLLFLGILGLALTQAYRIFPGALLNVSHGTWGIWWTASLALFLFGVGSLLPYLSRSGSGEAEEASEGLSDADQAYLKLILPLGGVIIVLVLLIIA